MSPSGKGLVELTNVSLTFGTRFDQTEAVRSVSLNVQPGEFVSLLGPSGCGKSSLLGIVAGFTKPTGGTATLNGVPIQKPSADRGVVFQQYSLLPWLTVGKNVEFGLRLNGVARKTRQETAQKLLKLAGLSTFADHYPEQLSGGMKQRIGILRALANNPQVLLMDEPFGALDTQTRSVMQELLTDMWQQFRMSVLFITHDIEESVFLSDRVYVMTARPGRVKAEIEIPLPRPRTPEVFGQPVFVDLVRELKSLIREEALAAMTSELHTA
jgi:NitT/TauT family transport system ATP-binding protein